MLMAAGLGTRLAPFTRLAPKALMPVMGVPVAQFAIDFLVRSGARRIVLNVHHLAEQLLAGLDGLSFGEAERVISDESALLLGSAGGIKKALPLLRSPFILTNADRLIDVSIAELLARHHALRSQWGVWLTLALFRRSPSGDAYREIIADQATGLVLGVGERRRDRPFFAGLAVVEHASLDGVVPGRPSEFVPAILEPAIQAGKVGFWLCDGPWIDIDSPALWLQAHLDLISRLETGALPSAWRKRIEAGNERISNGIWCARGAWPRRAPSEWAAPAYWSGGPDLAPRVLGPHAVLYGLHAGRSEFMRGIGFAGLWAESEQAS